MSIKQVQAHGHAFASLAADAPPVRREEGQRREGKVTNSNFLLSIFVRRLYQVLRKWQP